MNKQLRTELAAIARSQVGVMEEGGNNRGVKVEEYQRATWLKPGPWAWCMAFVDWCILALVTRHPNWQNYDFDRPRTASALGDHDVTFWARQEGLKVLGPQAPIEEGDIAVYAWGHVGIVTQPPLAFPSGYTPVPDVFTAVEGNTGPGGNTRDTERDGVYLRTRNRSNVLHFIRLEKEQV